MPLETANYIEGLDSSYPLREDPTNQGDDHLRLIKHVLETQFPGVDGGGFKEVITATEQELNWLGGLTDNVQVQFDDITARLDELEATLSAPTGTAMTFYQAAAPLGWTVSNVNNRMIRVNSASGGTSGGSDDPLLNDKVPTHNHAGSTNSTGSHTHSHRKQNSSVNEVYAGSGTAFQGGSSFSLSETGNIGSAGSHSHTVTVDNNTGGDTWSPRYVDVIIATKDAPA